MNMPLLLSVLCLVLCTGFFFYFRAFLRRNTAADRLLAEYRDEVYRLIAEIDAATDRDSQLVEERIKTLKSLLEDTDRRISVYVRELERSRSGEALYTSLGRGIRAALPPQPAGQSLPAPAAAPQAAPTPAAAVELFPPVDEAPPASVSVRGAGRSGKKQPGQSLPAPDAPAKTPDIRSQIAVLAARGLPAGEIASRLGLSRSEIDLALSLLNRSSAG